MSIKQWRPHWINPGNSELPAPILDWRVNRHLTVKGNATVKGNLVANIAALGSWQSYTPTAKGYTLPPPNTTEASNLNAICTGRWRQIDTLVFFQAVVSIGPPASGNWNSNLYVDLPTKANVVFTAQAAWHAQSQDDRGYAPCFGIGKFSSNQIMIVPDTNYDADVVLFASIGTVGANLPMDVIVSGSYEFQP